MCVYIYMHRHALTYAHKYYPDEKSAVADISIT